MAWSIIVVELALSWLHDLRRTDRRTLVLISQAVEALSIEGPALGRPLVDTVKGSALSNLKELRPGSAAPARYGCCSCSTQVDKPWSWSVETRAGNWRGWYRAAIPLAETAYADHLARMAKEAGTHE